MAIVTVLGLDKQLRKAFRLGQFLARERLWKCGRAGTNEDSLVLPYSRYQFFLVIKKDDKVHVKKKIGK